MKIEKPRGTRDFSPEDIYKRNYVENIITETFRSYNYRQIQVPTFEYAELFDLKSGDEIRQHMYVFKDKSDRELCLRPEATASICRMFVENFQNSQLPLKFYYTGPMFRYERPQKGRYREFWQVGVELIGPKNARSDAEVISMASDCLKKLGLKSELEIGHLGILRGLLSDLGISARKQDEVISAIDRGEKEKLEDLVEHGVLFDIIKLKGKKDVLKKAKSLLESYPSAFSAVGELSEITELLNENQTDYIINLGIARGLVYYTGMVFEIRVHGLGAQNQICGGGRYDSLIELFGGKRTPAVGFAFGFDRVVEAMEEQGIEIPKPAVDVVVAPVNNNVRADADKIAIDLRKEFSVDTDLMDRKLRKILEYASSINAKNVVIVGPKELANKEVILRDMNTGEQETVKISEIKKRLRERMSPKMIHIEKIGNATGMRILMQNAPLLLIIAKKGFISCGYLNIEIAEKIKDCACIVSGVNTFEDLLNAKVAKATSKAKELGIIEGMPAREALRLME